MSGKGKIIYIFGIDGSGKTTLVKNLNEYLKRKKVNVVKYLSKPFFTEELEEVSKSNNTTRRACFSPLFRGLTWGLDLLKKADDFYYYYEKGYIVLLDRYTLCNINYTMINTKNKHSNMLKMLHEGLPKPDIYIYLDTDIDIAYERVLIRGLTLTPKEIPSNLNKAKQNYESLLQERKVNYKRVNGNLPEEDVLKETISYLDKVGVIENDVFI